MGIREGSRWPSSSRHQVQMAPENIFGCLVLSLCAVFGCWVAFVSHSSFISELCKILIIIVRSVIKNKELAKSVARNPPHLPSPYKESWSSRGSQVRSVLAACYQKSLGEVDYVDHSLVAQPTCYCSQVGELTRWAHPH